MRVVRGGDLPAKQEMGATVRVFMTPDDGMANLSISQVNIQPGTSTTEHRHSDDQVVYVLEGELLLLGGGEQHHLGAGDAIYIPAGVTHQHQAVGQDTLKQLALFVPRVPPR